MSETESLFRRQSIAVRDRERLCPRENVYAPERVPMPQRERLCPEEECVIPRDEDRVIARAPDVRLT